MLLRAPTPNRLLRLAAGLIAMKLPPPLTQLVITVTCAPVKAAPSARITVLYGVRLDAAVMLPVSVAAQAIPLVTRIAEHRLSVKGLVGSVSTTTEPAPRIPERGAGCAVGGAVYVGLKSTSTA